MKDIDLKDRSTLYNLLIQVGMALSRAQELHDPYTSGHGYRVALISRKIAERMEWPEERILGLELAALLHDIGKMAVPSMILMKPGHLSRIEEEVVKEHVVRGYEVLKELDFPFPLADFVYQHHERLDGSGYPQGLKGDEISMESRILAVSDILESLTVKRPYRPELSLYEAIDILRDDSAKGQLDENVVDVAIELIKEFGDKFWM